jgi:hypothetical protein
MYPTTHPLSASRLIIALLCTAAVGGTAAAATLSVGQGKTYAAPCAAFAAAADGDTVEILGGQTYTGDVCSIKRNNLIIRGVTGRPKIDAGGKNAASKGIWVVDGNNITVDNVEMYGARVPDKNGAALRLQGTHFTLRNSFLHDNENGILANENVNSNILVEYSEFGHNGQGDGQSHNLYIGHVGSLTFRYSFSHDANVGHNLKSRAITNTIVYNRFSSIAPGQPGSTASGQPSYEIDMPNAGTAYVIGNVIQQPGANQNPAMLAFGEEGPSNPTQDLYVVNNTFLNEYNYSGTFLFIGKDVTVPALVQNNIFGGNGAISTNSNAILKNNYVASVPGFVDRAAYDLRPTANAAVLNAGTDPGVSASGVPLAPVAQYKGVASGEARPVYGSLDIGAYEATASTPTTPVATGSTDAWISCAGEGGYCTFDGTREVRFGANGSYFTKVATGRIACYNWVFGDPALNQLKSCAYSSTLAVGSSTTPPASGSTTPTTPTTPTLTITSVPTSTDVTWVSCAAENATCTFSGTHEVRYGGGNLYKYAQVTGSVLCANSVFGDPNKSTAKSCSYAMPNTAAPAVVSVASATATASATGTLVTSTQTTPAIGVTWVTCANEGQTCNVVSTREVRYGSNKFKYKVVTNSVLCSNSVFGDPAKQTPKSCSYAVTGAATKPAVAVSAAAIMPTSTAQVTGSAAASTNDAWIACASEGGTCSFSGKREVRYGGNNAFAFKIATGSLSCSNSVFGDPAKQTAKSCSYSSKML